MSDHIESDEIKLFVTDPIKIITDIFEDFYELPDHAVERMLDDLSVEEAAANPLGDPNIYSAFRTLRDWACREARIRREVNRLRREISKSRERRHAKA